MRAARGVRDWLALRTMSTPPGPIVVQPIDHATWQAMVVKMGLIYELAEESGLDVEGVPEGFETPDLVDLAIAWWRALPRGRRVDADELAEAAGLLVGDYLRQVCEFSWCHVTDGYGEGLALVHGTPRDERFLVLAPIDAMAKRLPSEPDGFVCDFVNNLSDIIDGYPRTSEVTDPAGPGDNS